MKLSKPALTIGSLLLAMIAPAQAVEAPVLADIEKRVAAVEGRMIAWRRDIHQHPELSNQEHRTAKLVAEHLKKLGLEVQTGVGGTGVVGLLKGALPGKVVALRADMDALPVKELTDLPFASKAKGKHMGKEVDVMHACGHDGHTAILMATAEVLAGMKSQLRGSVKFIFQPAEEGPSEAPHSEDEHIGALAMVDAGVLENPKVDAVFGLHLIPAFPVGTIGYRPGPILASGDTFAMKVTGRQTHGGFPWNGIDPIVSTAQIVMGLQTIVSRQMNLSKEPVVVSIGSIHGGNRENIIPDSVELLGTVRAFDDRMRDDTLLVNIARGGVADTGALVQHMDRLRLALDVFDPEPLPADSPLWDSPNVIVAPHLGGLSMAQFSRHNTLLGRQIEHLLAGEEPENVVVRS